MTLESISVRTASQDAFIEKILYSPAPRLYGEEFDKARRLHERLKAGETGLTQDEWEKVTSRKMLNGVVLMQPDPFVGEMTAKMTAVDRKAFYEELQKREQWLKAIKKA